MTDLILVLHCAILSGLAALVDGLEDDEDQFFISNYW